MNVTRHQSPPYGSTRFVYRYLAPLGSLAADGGVLLLLPELRWRQISAGQRPFDEPRSATVRLIVVSWQHDHCTAVDPVVVQTDPSGYLQTLDASLEALPAAVADLRGRFIQRYLERCHVWHPEPQVLQQVLQKVVALTVAARQ